MPGSFRMDSMLVRYTRPLSVSGTLFSATSFLNSEVGGFPRESLRLPMFDKTLVFLNQNAIGK
jgi:hypothetical protein